jgi:hypothetical protein
MEDSTPPDEKSPPSVGHRFSGSRVVLRYELFPLDLKQIACRQTVATRRTKEGRSWHETRQR